MSELAENFLTLPSLLVSVSLSRVFGTLNFNSSNLAFPCVNDNLGFASVVINPLGVASNGGEVSVGGQHSCLSPLNP